MKDDPNCTEDDKVDEGRKPFPESMIILMRSIWMLTVHRTSDDDDDDDKKKEERVEEAKKELDEEPPNEGNEFAHELKKVSRDAGKDEFEVDGKKVQSSKKELPETDEEVVAEVPPMDTTQLINLLKNLV